MGDNGVDLHAADVGLADERGVVRWGGLMIQQGSGKISLNVGQIRHLVAAALFVTGDNGLGHLVFMVPDMQAFNDFPQRVGLSSFRRCGSRCAHTFYALQPRHHTLASLKYPGTEVCILMLEVDSRTQLAALTIVLLQQMSPWL